VAAKLYPEEMWALLEAMEEKKRATFTLNGF